MYPRRLAHFITFHTEELLGWQYWGLWTFRWLLKVAYKILCDYCYRGYNHNHGEVRRRVKEDFMWCLVILYDANKNVLICTGRELLVRYFRHNNIDLHVIGAHTTTTKRWRLPVVDVVKGNEPLWLLVYFSSSCFVPPSFYSCCHGNMCFIPRLIGVLCCIICCYFRRFFPSFLLCFYLNLATVQLWVPWKGPWAWGDLPESVIASSLHLKPPRHKINIVCE